MYILCIDFSWGDKKAEANLKKHKVSFEEATSVFFDSNAIVAPDPDHSEDEDRYILVGYSRSENLLFVVHIYFEESDRVRIISARKATKHEQRDFEELS